MSYFIVEHPTRGVYMGYSDDTVWAKPKFSRTNSRAQCKRYTMLEEALIRAVFSGMPAKCFVVEMPAGKVIPVELGPVIKRGTAMPDWRCAVHEADRQRLHRPL